MNSLLSYLLQVIIISGILYIYYHVVLRNERFHRYNRFYLLASSLLSMLIPLLNIPVYFTENQVSSSGLLRTLSFISDGADTPVTIQSISKVETSLSWLTWPQVLYIIYIAIGCIALVRVILSLLKIRQLIRHNPSEIIETIRFVNTSEPGTPFSFFRWLFWNNKIELSSNKGEQIFRHELFHIRQGHSADVMLLELLTVVCWVNPFFHLMKRETKAIHEFLADQFAIRKADKWQYAELLLMQALNTTQSLVNPFFHNQIKRRIAMITTSKKTGYRYARSLLVLPLAATIVALFAFSYKKSGANRELITEKPGRPLMADDTSGHKYPDTLVWENGHRVQIITQKLASPKRKSPTQEEMNKWLDSKMYGVWIGNRRIKNSDLMGYKPSDFSLYYVSKLEKNAVNYGKHYYQVDLLTEKDYIRSFPADSVTYHIRHMVNDTSGPGPGIENIIFSKVEIEPSFPGGDAAWRRYLERNLDAAVPVRKQSPPGAYSVIIRFVVSQDGNLTDVKALTHYGYGMEEEAIRVIKEGPKWAPAVQNGKNVNAYKLQPVTFVIGSGQKIPVGNALLTPEQEKKKLNEIVITSFEDSSISPPKFPGGEAAWRSYLLKNLNASLPVDSGAPAGTYKVVVQFKVAADGSLSSFRPKTNWGYGMENEIIRILKNNIRWEPAVENGKRVAAYTEQPVTFVVSEEFEKISVQNLRLRPSLTAAEKALYNNILYIGTDNYISVNSTEVEPENIIAIISEGSITGENGKYHIQVRRATDDLKLTVTTKSGEKLGEFKFKVRAIPATENKSGR